METTDSMVMFRPSRDEMQTIMVLDLCGSSELASENEIMAVHLNRRLEQISGAVLDAHHATSFKNTGDGFLATFSDCALAIEAALYLIKSLAERNKGTVNAPIDVRIALHYGKIYLVFDTGTKEVYGHDVNIAFRIERVQAANFETLEAEFPERNRILCTKQFCDIVSQHRSCPSIRFVSCGGARVKGIEELQQVYWIQEIE